MSDDSSEDISEFHQELVDVLTSLTKIASRLQKLEAQDDIKLTLLLNRSQIVLERLTSAEALLKPIRLQ